MIMNNLRVLNHNAIDTPFKIKQARERESEKKELQGLWKCLLNKLQSPLDNS
jgi:hypothetical protein